MKVEKMEYERDYKQSVTEAHQVLREDDIESFAHICFAKGMYAQRIYDIDGEEEWDMRTYGALNAAGRMFEGLGQNWYAEFCYTDALISLERVSIGRGPEWQKNINYLKSALERVSEENQG